MPTKNKFTTSQQITITCPTPSDTFVIGADAPVLSEKAKQQLMHKRPSKRAAKLAATALRANVRCTAVV